MEHDDTSDTAATSTPPVPAPPQKVVDERPPIGEGELVRLFDNARAGITHSNLLAAAYQANAAVNEALKRLREELPIGLDEHTRGQLEHIITALSVVSTQTVSACSVSLNERAKPTEPTVEENRSPSGLRKKIRKKWGSGDHHKNQTGEPEGDFSVSARGAGSLTPDRTARATSDMALPAMATGALDAVGKALGHVERAFDRRPRPVELSPPSWHEHQGLMNIIQALIDARIREHPEKVWNTIDQMRDMLPVQGIKITYYDPDRLPEQQADAFLVEDRAKGLDCSYQTDIPALTVTTSDGGRRIVARGRVLRLPATNVQSRQEGDMASGGADREGESCDDDRSDRK